MAVYHFTKAVISKGFWAEKQKLIRETTIWNVYKRFSETGRFEAFKINWKEGMPNKPHIFWDSDVAKWLESVAYLTEIRREPKLEAIVDDIVDDIERGRMKDGYFNSCYQTQMPEKRFLFRPNHELYCAGHLIEAAIAYDKATGKSKFLNLMKDYASLIKKVFMEEKSAGFTSPGHEEIELALIKLYDYTKESQWLDLAKFFIDERGVHEKEEQGDSNIQDHMPVRSQETAEGHAVRACYLYSAMADIALRTNDSELKAACDRIFDNIVNRKMYITGAIGSSHRGEVFEDDYRLPNDTAYAETCAAIALAFFAHRMTCFDADSVYADTIERVIYNGFLSGISLDGKSFFYENAQEIDLENRKIVRAAIHDNHDMHFPITQRVEVFECSCCPPNVTRFISSIGDFIYHCSEDTMFINQYMDSETSAFGAKIIQKTDFSYDGRISVSVDNNIKLALRIPQWCKVWSVLKNGVPEKCTPVKGYAYIDAEAGDEIILDMKLEVRFIKANHLVRADRGMTAVTYGPFVMCLEAVDNNHGTLFDVKLTDESIRVFIDDKLHLPCVEISAVHEIVRGLYSDEVDIVPFTAKFIPYFAFANRGEADMRIWLPKK